MLGDAKNEIELKGLSFYVNAVKKPWSRNYQMYSYVNEELPGIIQEHFNVKKDRQSIMGHRYTYIIQMLKRKNLNNVNQFIINGLFLNVQVLAEIRGGGAWGT